MSSYYCGNADEGGVHYNSGIIARLLVRYADRTKVDNARSIWNVLSWDKTYLSPFTDVPTFRDAFLRAVDDTLPSTRTQALQALQEVGLTASSTISC